MRSGARHGALHGPRHRPRRAAPIARLGLGYVPEDRRIFTDLTVLENLDVGRQPPRAPDGAPRPAWTPEALFKLFPNLGEMPTGPAAA
jgi:branched-chain amino acid transport system ATP-binding protein